MYVGQTAACLRQFPSAFREVQEKHTQKNQIVDMLNEQANKESPLEAARSRVNKLRDALEAYFDPKIEKLLEGYKRLASECTASRKELDFQQGQLNEYQSLSGQYNAIQKELTETKAQFQDSIQTYGDRTGVAEDGSLDPSPEAASQRDMAERISALSQSLWTVDCKLTNFVEQCNERAMKAAYGERFLMSGMATSREGKRLEKKEKGPYTRENFGAQISQKVSELQTEVKQRSQALADYCNRYGLTPYDFEEYIAGKSKLSADFFAAQQELLDLLEQDGEDVDRLIDKRA